MLNISTIYWVLKNVRILIKPLNSKCIGTNHKSKALPDNKLHHRPVLASGTPAVEPLPPSIGIYRADGASHRRALSAGRAQ
jgi:hypothetical protein